MRCAVLLALAASLAGLASIGRAEDSANEPATPDLAKVYAAAKAYEQALEKVRAGAVETLQKAEKAATKRANLEKVKAIRAGVETVKTRGVIPAGAVTETQKRQLARSRDALASAYAAAVKEFTRAGDLNQAEAMERKREALMLSRVFVSGPVPDDAREHSGRFYKVFTDRIPWHEARRRCELMGGHLAIVRDEETNRFLTELVTRASRQGVWLGATDERAEGVWFWVDGSPMRFSAWGAGQPTNRSSLGEVEHYLALIAVDGGRWNDFPNHGERGGPPAFCCEW
jgi:hypothetical protein